MTASGVNLVDNNSAYTISHTSKSLSQNTFYTGPYANSSNPAATVGGDIDGIWVGGKDITGDINGGKIGAAIDMRDTELPDAQKSLDTLATQLSTTLNTVSNQTSVSIAGSTLTGSQAMTTPIVTTAGTLRFAQIDSSGNAVGKAVDLTIPANADCSITAIKSADQALLRSIGACRIVRLDSSPALAGISPGASGQHTTARRKGVVYLT